MKGKKLKNMTIPLHRPGCFSLLVLFFLSTAAGPSQAYQEGGGERDDGFSLFPNRPESEPEDITERKKKLLKPKKHFNIDMGIGYSTVQGEMRPGAWYPVWILIEAKVGDAEGVATITQQENPMIVETEFFVKEGSKKRYQTYYKLFAGDETLINDTIEAAVVSKGVAPKTIPLNYRVARPSAQNVLVFTEETGSFRFLVRRESSNEEIDAGYLPDRTITYGIVDLLPESATALEGVDAIVLNGPRVRRINQRQWQVLRGWVASGGKLLLAGGRHQPFIAQSNLAGAFGMKIGPTESVNLTVPTDGAKGESEKSLQVLAAFPEWTEGQWDAIGLGDKNRPWIVGKRVGNGWFHYCAFALDEEPLAALAGIRNGTAFWSNLLERNVAATNLDNLVEAGGGAFEKGLQKTFVIHLAGLSWIFLYLLLFNVVAIPLNWWICKRYKRSDWSWFVFLTMAVGFAWFGYYSGMKRQRQTFQVNELTLVRKAEGVTAARATAFDVVYSPRKYRKGIATNALVFPVPLTVTQDESQSGNAAMWRGRNISRRGRKSFQTLSQAPFLPITLSFSGRTDVKNLNILAFASKTYRTDFTLENAGNVTAVEPIRFPYDTSRLSGRLLNETPWTFQRVWIGNGSDFWTYRAPWKPGEDLDAAEMKHTRDGREWRHLVEEVLKESFQQALQIRERSLENANGNRQPQLVSEPLEFTEADWRGYMAANRRDGRFYFWGETNQYQAPLFASVQSRTNIQRMIFEQPLPVSRALYDESSGKWNTLKFGFRIKSIGDEKPGPEFLSYDSDIKRGRRILLDFIDLEIFPSGPLHKEDVSSLEIRLSLASYPDSTAYIVSLDDKDIYPYAMTGCPVGIFNFDLHRWESLGVWTGSWENIENPRAYLSDDDSVLLLRLDARPNEIRYRQRDPDTKKARDVVKTGAELNGSQGAQSGFVQIWRDDSGQTNKAYGFGPGSKSGVALEAQIERLEVRLNAERGAAD